MYSFGNFWYKEFKILCKFGHYGLPHSQQNALPTLLLCDIINAVGYQVNNEDFEFERFWVQNHQEELIV